MNYFKKGDTVKVIKGYCNASDFTIKESVCAYNGVYSLEDWRDVEFTIKGNLQPISFKNSPDVYGAYPLVYDGKLKGYVYNDAIQLVKSAPKSRIKKIIDILTIKRK